MSLDERKMLVLRAIIDDYIHTAEPVGSRTIARRHKLGVSPATIRNEMADLEDTGYLQQPHISAGRIPSDKGYRFYVDVLMEPEPIPTEERARIYEKVSTKRQEIEKLVQETSQLLSLLTNYTAVVIAPPVNSAAVRHIQLVPIDHTNLLLVLVLHPGMVQNRIIRTETPPTLEQCHEMSVALNKRLRGLTYREISSSVIRSLQEQLGDIADVLLAIITDELSSNDQGHLYLHGTLHIFNHPEFKDLDRARCLLAVLERKEVLSAVLDKLARGSGVHAGIGHENSNPEIQECSIVTATYHIGGEVVGAIGVIGPTRMEYAKVFSTVELLAGHLSEILSALVR